LPLITGWEELKDILEKTERLLSRGKGKSQPAFSADRGKVSRTFRPQHLNPEIFHIRIGLSKEGEAGKGRINGEGLV